MQQVLFVFTKTSEGWIPVNIGSRFCSQAQRKYSAIKGELLGETWALDKTRHWTLGCPGLLVFTDLKPLLGLVKQTDLETVTPRLLRLMEKLLQWNFTIHNISGEKNAIPDDLSRFPWALAGVATMGPSSQEVEDTERLEEAVLVEISLFIVSWQGLQVASKADEEIQEVCRLMREGADLQSK